MSVPINYWAVLVCGVASMVIGSLWYGPLFGKLWQSVSGWDKVSPEERAAAMKAVQKSYILAFVFALVMAYVLAHAIAFAEAYTGVHGISSAVQGALWNWLGFVVPVTLASVLWENKPWKFFFLSSGYYLIQLFVFALILVYWR